MRQEISRLRELGFGVIFCVNLISNIRKDSRYQNFGSSIAQIDLFEFSRRDAPRRSGCRCQHLANQHDLDEMAPPVDSLNAHDAPIQWIRADLG